MSFETTGAREQQMLLPFENRSSDIIALLDRALDCLAGPRLSNSAIGRRLQNLRERLVQQRFQLAVLGQFKRGKSSFLNSLLGAPLLPTGVVPLTAIPTFIAWGAKPIIRVTYHANRAPQEFGASTSTEIRDRLFAFVAEEANPKNRLDVARVDLFYPSSFLTNGLVLIDTPGIGSTHRHNTDAALQVLPECDAALFVVSSDPPITEAELLYLKTVSPMVARLFLVFNKVDFLEPDELQSAIEFLLKTVHESLQAQIDPKIFPLSARDGLRAKITGDHAALEKSGIAEIETYLLNYLAQEKMAALRTAISRKASELVTQAEADLELRIRTLEMPIEDLTRRSTTLEQALQRVTREERVIRDLLSGDRRRAVEQLEIHAEQLRQMGYQYLTDVLDRVLSLPNQSESQARKAMTAAIPEFFEQKLSAISAEFSRTVEAIFVGHQQRIDDLVNLVRRTAADLFEVRYAASADSEQFKIHQEPYWVTEKFSDTLISVPTAVIDPLLPSGLRRERLRARCSQQAAELVQRNVENLRWATLQGLDATFRRFASSLEERLTEAVGATQGAVKAATATRTVTSSEADADLGALQRVSRTLAEIRTDLGRTPAQRLDFEERSH